jgi:hypothetical protein
MVTRRAASTSAYLLQHKDNGWAGWLSRPRVSAGSLSLLAPLVTDTLGRSAGGRMVESVPVGVVGAGKARRSLGCELSERRVGADAAIVEDTLRPSLSA